MADTEQLDEDKCGMDIHDTRPPVRHIANHVIMDYCVRSQKDLWPFVDWEAVDGLGFGPLPEIVEKLTEIVHAASARFDAEAPEAWKRHGKVG